MVCPKPSHVCDMTRMGAIKIIGRSNPRRMNSGVMQIWDKLWAWNEGKTEKEMKVCRASTDLNSAILDANCGIDWLINAPNKAIYDERVDGNYIRVHTCGRWK